MRYFRSLALAFAVLSQATAQNVTIPATNGSLPAAGANGCAAGYFPGSSTVLYTVPYTYDQVLSIIGNYTNLTWSGSPPNSVTTNNSEALITNDWTPGTARFYHLDGAYLIETITTYEKPADGPYVEIHTLAPLRIPSADLDVYAAFDGVVWKPICNGSATWSNFTINFCATNVTTATALLDEVHLSDAETVGKFLGGQNFTSCAALTSNGTINGTTSPSPTASMPATYTGLATKQGSSGLLTLALALVVFYAVACI